MQLCQIHFYQKIARKKVARVNAALFSSLGSRMSDKSSKIKLLITKIQQMPKTNTKRHFLKMNKQTIVMTTLQEMAILKR